MNTKENEALQPTGSLLLCWQTNIFSASYHYQPISSRRNSISFCCYLHHQFFNRLRLRAGHYKIPAQQQALYVGKRKMTFPKKQIILTLVATTIFYIVGRLAYEFFYRWTLDLIKKFSGDTVSFFGKFPFWFFGDPVFGLVFCFIPVTFFICYIILKDKLRFAFNWTLAFYLSLLTIFYLLNCYGQSIELVASNDFYKMGQTLTYNLRQVNVNSLFLRTIALTTILTAIINSIKRYRVTKNASLQQAVLRQQG